MTVCLADWRCRHYDHIQQQPADTNGDRPLCEGDLTYAGQAVAALILDYRDLEQHIPPILGQWGDGQPGRSGEAPIPINVHVEALQRDIWALSMAWAEVIADRYTLSHRPTRCRDGYAVNWAVMVLRNRMGELARVEPIVMADYPFPDEELTTRFGAMELTPVAGWQGVLDLARMHERARAVLGLNGLTKQLPGYCRDTRCGRPGLLQDNGSDTVRCGHCGATMSRDDWESANNLFGRRRAAAA
jgi:hypothetical protein